MTIGGTCGKIPKALFRAEGDHVCHMRVWAYRVADLVAASFPRKPARARRLYL